jgi:hypothetical protein
MEKAVRYRSTFDGLTKQLNDIFADHSFRLEALRPGDKTSCGQTFLHAWKRKGEAERKSMVFHSKLFHKTGQTLSNVIEQLSSAAQHELLRNRINFIFHVELFAINVDQQNSKVGSAQIQSQEFAVFCANKAKEKEKTTRRISMERKLVA